MRRPRDRLSQRVLVYDLRHAIDRCMRRPWDTVAQRHLDTLIAENPHNVRGGHVLYNIGVTRREWLARRAPLSLPTRPEPSLGGRKISDDATHK